MAEDNVVNFDALELEGDNKGNNTSQKLMDHMRFLKEKLSPTDYSKAVQDLGFNTDLSNEQLLEEIKTLLGKKEGVEDEEEEELMSYKDFIAKCMGEGKVLKDCITEYKEKYPEAEEPSKEEQTELEQLEQSLALAKKKKEEEYPGPDQKKMKALQDQLTQLTASVEALTTSREQEKNTAELSIEVDKLVEEKHLAPSQKEGIIKLAGGMSPEEQQGLLTFFRTTQKLSGLFDDKGLMVNTGLNTPSDITPEKRAELIKTFKIDEIIEDRGVKPRRNN